MSQVVETDARSRVTLPGGKGNRHYLLDEQPDGTVILRPAVVMAASDAQKAYDNNPKLRAALDAALAAPVTKHPRPRKRGAAAEA